MRLLLCACLILVSSIPSFGGAEALARPARAARHCPELRTEGFCPYDTGWRPAADNPLFSPLRPDDPQGGSGPSCAISDSRGRTLMSYETEDPAPTLRIGGQLAHFRPVGSAGSNRFVSPEGRLTIREGALVARDHESDGHRATLTFVDRSGHAHIASVRIDCGV